MTSVIERPAPRTRPTRRLMWAAPVLGGVLGLVAISQALRSPPTVDHVTVVNATNRPLTVAVSNDTANGVLLLGTVDADETLAFDRVVDQGGVWRFHLSDGPDELRGVRYTRAELDRAGWRVTLR